VWLPLWRLFGVYAGFNVSLLLGLLVSAYTAYLLVRHLTDSRVAAWVGGVYFAFNPVHISRVIPKPNTGNIQWLPLFMVALVVGLHQIAASSDSRRSLSRRDAMAMALAAVALALNAYVSVKPWMQVVLLGALYVPLAALLGGWWRRVAFWQGLGVFVLVSLPLLLPVLAPIYYQTIHRRPIVEGVVARVPAGARDYIDSNALLRAWEDQKRLVCTHDLEQAIGDLRADGFEYIVVHKQQILE